MLNKHGLYIFIGIQKKRSYTKQLALRLGCKNMEHDSSNVFTSTFICTERALTMKPCLYRNT